MTTTIVTTFKQYANKYKHVLFAGMLTGLLTHMFAFTNKLVNHDEISAMFSKGATLSSGRWGLDILSLIFPDFSMPWIYGIISVVLITCSACLVVNIFNIENSIQQILIAGLFTSFPSLIATFTYMFTAASYALAFFLSVLSVKLLLNKRFLPKIVSIFLFVFSLSIYQAYLSITAGLLLLYIIYQLLHGKKPLDCIKQGFFFLLYLALSLIVYYVATQFLLKITHLGFNSYANDALSSESTFLQKIYLAYLSFYRILRVGAYGLIPSSIIRILHILLLLVTFIKLLIVWYRKDLATKILLCILCMLIPLCINCIFLISDPSGIHTLVLYGFCTIYVFLIIIADTASFEKSGKVTLNGCIRSIISVALLVITVSNIYLGNQVYLHLHLKYENTYAFYSSVVTTIKTTPGFDENSKLALIGTSQNHVTYHHEFVETLMITGANGISVTDYSKYDFIKRYLGFNIQIASDEEIEEIKKTQEYQDMPEYPYYGSVKKIHECIVVKFGDS